jgi:hypothetical protein
MRGVLVQSKPMRANGADVSVAEAAHVFAANATDVASAAKASNVTSTAKTAAHMAAATEAAAKSSAVTATTAPPPRASAAPASRLEARRAVAITVIIRFIVTLLFSQIARRCDARSTSHANETSDD